MVADTFDYIVTETLGIISNSTDAIIAYMLAGSKKTLSASIFLILWNYCVITWDAQVLRNHIHSTVYENVIIAVYCIIYCLSKFTNCFNKYLNTCVKQEVHYSIVKLNRMESNIMGMVNSDQDCCYKTWSCEPVLKFQFQFVVSITFYCHCIVPSEKGIKTSRVNFKNKVYICVYDKSAIKRLN